MNYRWAWSALFLLGAGCGGPPQLGAVKENHGAVDALFTALTSRRPALLDQSAGRLQRLRATGTLPEAAAARLDAIVAKARRGEWEPAARDLADFMSGQRWD